MPSVEAVLCDAGILIALFDLDDFSHRRCWDLLHDSRCTLLSAWPVLAEVFYLLESSRQREKLWELVLGGGLRIPDLSFNDMRRMRELMVKYSDLPMDLADASLVALAERLRLKKVFTLDRRHFQVYRPRHVHSFEILP